MKIKSATYLKSALRLEDCPKDVRPEISFSGRSNVGKSSLLNCVLNKRGLAQVSKTPGKTRTLNFFDVNKKFYFVDLPGYGFAKVSFALKDEWGEAITRYLQERKQLALCVQLVDARHKPTALDRDMIELLADGETPMLIVATKADKLAKNEREKAVERICKGLGIDDPDHVLLFSSLTGEGVGPFWRALNDVVSAKKKK